MEYIIGLIDEESIELGNIRRTIKTHMDNIGFTISFKEYLLSGGADTLTSNVTEAVIEDIVSNSINSLIIDYKLMIESAKVEGTDIFRMVLDRVPRFPVVILTDVPDDCYEKEFVDADKVYWKRHFFKIEGDYSKDKTRNLFLNMERYIRQRSELTLKLQELLRKFETVGFSQDLYQEIISIENDLDNLFPQGQTRIEKALKTDDLKQAVALLQEAEKMISVLP